MNAYTSAHGSSSPRPFKVEGRGGDRKSSFPSKPKSDRPPKPKKPNHVDDLLARVGQSIVIVTTDQQTVTGKLLSADMFTITVESRLSFAEGEPMGVVTVYKHSIFIHAFAKDETQGA